MSLEEAAIAVDEVRPRSVQSTLGASTLSMCVRRAGYVHHGVQESDVTETGMSAILGTWLHEGALEAMRLTEGALVETQVGYGTPVSGNVDLIYLSRDYAKRIRSRYRPKSHEQTIVEDLKTIRNERTLQTRIDEGPRESHVRQVYTYVALLSKFGTQVNESRPHVGLQRAVTKLGPINADVVRIRYLSRESGAEWVWEEPVDPARLAEAFERISLVCDSARPEDLPRELDGPGLSAGCDFCPFRTECWGYSGDGDPQALLIHEGQTDVEQELEKYFEGFQLEKQGRDMKKKARAVLSDTENGQYGGFVLDWSKPAFYRAKPDASAMQALIEDLGYEVPLTEPRYGSRSISVGRAV